MPPGEGVGVVETGRVGGGRAAVGPGPPVGQDQLGASVPVLVDLLRVGSVSGVRIRDAVDAGGSHRAEQREGDLKQDRRPDLFGGHLATLSHVPTTSSFFFFSFLIFLHNLFWETNNCTTNALPTSWHWRL